MFRRSWPLDPYAAVHHHQVNHRMRASTHLVNPVQKGRAAMHSPRMDMQDSFNFSQGSPTFQRPTLCKRPRIPRSDSYDCNERNHHRSSHTQSAVTHTQTPFPTPSPLFPPNPRSSRLTYKILITQLHQKSSALKTAARFVRCRKPTWPVMKLA